MQLLVRKRTGEIVSFDQSKITNAIYKAAKAVGGKDRKTALELSNAVFLEMQRRFPGDSIPTVEEVQDLVEKTLIEKGHAKTAKAYILYRRQHEDLRSVEAMMNSFEIVQGYIGKTDWKVYENSNMNYSLQGLNNYIAGEVIANYWLRKLYPGQIGDSHSNGDVHIHDLGTLGPYCVGWDLQDLLTEGFGHVSGKIDCKPPKHLRTALGQVVNFFYTLQGEAAGAQAFSSFDTLLAPFIRQDGLSYQEVHQAMQEFVFNVNVPTRVGFQTPFTNITLDLVAPKNIRNTPATIGGQPIGQAYGDYAEEMTMINKAFADTMMEGDAKGRVFTFPIPTYNITKDFDWESEVSQKIFEMTAKYGIPYFANYVNSDMQPDDARSMCCRLRLDNRELRKRGGGLFGASPLTGSIGVVTVNMPRLGYLSKTEDEFFERLGRLMDVSRDALEIKRKIIESFTDKGMYPYSKFYLRGVKEATGTYWTNHFNTIGLVGMNEALTNLLGTNITTKEGIAFAEKTLDFMRNRLADYQEETGNYYNLEATPAEGTSHRLARIDKKKYPNIKLANNAPDAKPFYTNSTQLPVNHTRDVFEALDLQESLQTRYTGGTVLHIFLGERIDWQSARAAVKKIAENYRLPYYTLTPTFSVCPKHGYLAGEHPWCPVCDKEIGFKDENAEGETHGSPKDEMRSVQQNSGVLAPR